MLRITGPAPPHVAASVNQVKRGNRRKQTYRAPDGSPPVRSRGEGSRPNSGSSQSEGARPRSPRPSSPPPQQPQLEPQQPEQPVEEEKPWIRKPFNAVVESYRVVKEQYQSLERILDSISLYLDVEPRYLLDRIQGLSKHQELEDLQAKVDCLLKENGELKTKVEEGQALQKEMDELRNWIAAVEEEAKIARAERDNTKTVAQKIHGYLGFPGDVLNKARLYNHGLKQLTTDSGVKMMRYMVDYGRKLEKTLKELRALLHPTGAQPELVGTPGAGPSTIPAPTPSPEFVTPTVTQPDPLLQEPIPDINTEDLASLKSWVEAGPKNLTTPTIGTGTNIPGNLSTLGTISQE